MSIATARSLVCLVVFTTAVANMAQAQTSQGTTATSSKAQRLEWPRTFSGQPDFAFTRDEALTEARTQASRNNAPLPLMPSLPMLLNDDSVLDPLGLTTSTVSGTSIDASGTVVDSSGTTPPAGLSLMDQLMARSVDLPTVAQVGKPDLKEFSDQLTATIQRTVANWQPRPGRYDFGAVLNSLVLQAIVTSPIKYAVINQQRYVEGETFRISVPLPVPDTEIIAALRAQMPVSGTLPASLQSSYEEAYLNALGTFNVKRNQSPEIGQQTLVLPVRITTITPRQVLLDVNGQSYALQIRYAY